MPNTLITNGFGRAGGFWFGPLDLHIAESYLQGLIVYTLPKIEFAFQYCESSTNSLSDFKLTEVTLLFIREADGLS